MPNRVLLTVGRRLDPVALGALPPNVHVEPWVEQSDALAAAALVVCHGGSGTVFGALGAGLPVVVVPSFVDQLTNGRRVAAAGAALLVETAPERAKRRMIGEPDAPLITAAATDALSRPGYRAAARRIGAEMAAAPCIEDVLADLAG